MFHNKMDRIQDVVGLAVLGAFSTSISATFGVITLLLTGADIQAVIWTVWYTWWIGDFMGALVIAPLFLVWHANWPFSGERRKYVEAVVIALIILMVTGYVFLMQPASGVTHEALIYVIFPFVIYSALRLKQLGAVNSIVLVSGIAILGTVLGTGPLVRESLNESLILLQTFMGVVSLTALTLAATTHQRQQAEEALHQRIDDLSKINEASQTFLGIFDSPTTYQTICKVAVTQFGATAAWICLVDDEGQTQTIQSSHGLSPDLLESINAQVRKQPDALTIPDGSALKVFLKNAENQPLFYLVFPLSFAGKQIGELRLVSSLADFFTTDRKILFESYANLAAVAIQNTWLLDQVKSGNERLHALSHRLMEVQETEKLNLCRELHDESGQVISAMMVQLGLLERDANNPEMIRQYAQNSNRSPLMY